jgi:hypothetical protein
MKHSCELIKVNFVTRQVESREVLNEPKQKLTKRQAKIVNSRIDEIQRTLEVMRDEKLAYDLEQELLQLQKRKA